jgi:CRISPR/Cas system-associated exonuclease Cas4 (RecB family)
MAVRTLSKSKLLAYRQCPKRLWLEIHHPELREDSPAARASQEIGHTVGEIARKIYDPQDEGVFLDLNEIDLSELLTRSETLCRSGRGPIFEAGFSANGALSIADVMLPVKDGRKRAWRMVEVKSSTELKDYHRDDAAIQAYITRSAGVPLQSIAIAHIDRTWTYPGKGDYQGLLTEHDITEEAFDRGAEVAGWIESALTVARKRKEPAITTGAQCKKPYPCGYMEYCLGQEPQPKYPASWLPRMQSKALKELLADGVTDMRDVPDDLLNDLQLRVKSCTLKNKVFFDAEGAADDLAPYRLPAYFLDFETIQFAVPIWKGLHPYDQVPFQFSLHRLSRTGKLEHREFLDLSGKDPSPKLAAALVEACGERGPIFVYNASFETSRIREMGERFPKLRKSLTALNKRIVDLLPITRARYYHPSQQGSWSIKAVLPAIAPTITYDQLDGVRDGGMAMEAYQEAVSKTCAVDRKTQIASQLLKYGSLDTMAMIEIWKYFATDMLN